MRIPHINDNPLRVLGVFANATLRETEKNKAQLRAFAHVGQKAQLPLWLNGLKLLTPLNDVTEEMLAQAQAQLALQKERDLYALFWFEQDKNHVQEEDKAIELLNSNRVSEARQLWEQRSDHAALKNLLLLAVMDDDWNRIAACTSRLFRYDTAGFHTFMEEVVKLSPKANGSLSLDLLPHFTEDTRRAEMRQMLVRNHQHFLDEAIDRLKRTKSEDADILKEEINRMMIARNRVDALKRMLGKDSFTYSCYAKETAKALMNATIRYSKQISLVDDFEWAAGIVSEIWADIDLSDSENSGFWNEKNLIEAKAKMTRVSDSSVSSGCADTIWSFICMYGCLFFFAFLFRGGCGGHKKYRSLYRYNYQKNYAPPKLNLQPTIDVSKIQIPSPPQINIEESAIEEAIKRRSDTYISFDQETYDSLVKLRDELQDIPKPMDYLEEEAETETEPAESAEEADVTEEQAETNEYTDSTEHE